MTKQLYYTTKSNRLFKNQYRYKLMLFKFESHCHGSTTIPKQKYFKKIENLLTSTTEEFELTQTYSHVMILSNSKEFIDNIINVDPNRVAQFSTVKKDDIIADTIFLPRIPFDFKVNLRKSLTNHKSFIEWARPNKNIKLTNSCIRALNRDWSYGGTYFYVKGENNLLLAKMQLGEIIGKIEKIIN